MSPHRPGVSRCQRLGAVTVGAGPIGVVVFFMTAGTGQSRIDRVHRQRNRVTGPARLLGVPPVRESNGSFTRGVIRYGHRESRDQRVIQPGRHMALSTPFTSPDLVMADLAAPGSLERELLPGPGEMAGQAGHFRVAAMGEAVVRLSSCPVPADRLLPSQALARERAQKGGSNEQAPEGVRPPGPAIGRSEVMHGGCRESTSRRTRSARRAPGRPTA